MIHWLGRRGRGLSSWTQLHRCRILGSVRGLRGQGCVLGLQSPDEKYRNRLVMCPVFGVLCGHSAWRGRGSGLAGRSGGRGVERSAYAHIYVYVYVYVRVYVHVHAYVYVYVYVSVSVSVYVYVYVYGYAYVYENVYGGTRGQGREERDAIK